MPFVNKMAMTEEFCYQLRYKLITVSDKPVIHIHCLKYDRNSYLMNVATTPLCTETNFAELPASISENDADKIFNKIAENFVFPASLDYILEDMNYPSPNGKNHRIIQKSKISASHLITAR